MRLGPAEGRVATHALHILSGHADQAAQDIATQVAQLAPDRRTGADEAIDYLRGKADYLRYDLPLTHGWPIATGVIEGACGHVLVL